MKKLVAVSAAVLITGGSLLGFAAPSFADDSGSSTGVSGVVADSTTTTTATPVQTAAPAPAEVATPTPAPTEAPQAVATPAPTVTPSPAPAVVSTTPAVVPQPKPPVDTGATTTVSWIVPTGGTEAAPFAGGAQTLYTNQCGVGHNLIQNDVYHYGTPSAIQLVDALKASGTLNNYADTPVFISATWSYLPLCAPPAVIVITPTTEPEPYNGKCSVDGTDNGGYTVPTIDHITYNVVSSTADSVHLTATADNGYSIQGATEWFLNWDNPGKYQSVSPGDECYVAPVVVTPPPATPPVTTPATPTVLTTSPEAPASDTSQEGVLAHTGSSINFVAYGLIASVLLVIGAFFMILSVLRRRYDHK